MNKTGNSYDSFGDWASPNQHPISSYASTKKQLSESSMKPLMHLLRPSANNQTPLIYRQTLISGWIRQMPAVLDDYLL